MAKLLCVVMVMAFFFSAQSAFATAGAGGTCPTGANYVSSSNPTGPLVTLSSLGVTNCYFVAANGSDTNNGTSESTPWLHAPQMPNCSNSCATVQNQSNGIPPGTGIIFRGGDTWHEGNPSASPYTGGEWNFNASPSPMGTLANPIYLGVDQTWFTGGSWVRPVLTLDNPVCGPSNLGGSCNSGSLPTGITQYYVSSCTYTLSPQNMIDLSGLQYYIVDNFEMTGLCQNSVGQPSTDNYLRYGSLRNPVTFQNLYIHGWTHVHYVGQNSSPSCNTGVCFDIFAFQGGPNDVLRYDVVDGADSDPEAGGVCFKGFYDVAYSVFQYVSTCLPGSLHSFHDNLYQYFFENGHSDMLAFAENASSTDVVYNNVFRHIDTTGATGTPVIWANPPSSTSVYFFNNLIYDVGSVEYLNIGNAGSAYGTYYFFNNTFQSNVSQTIMNCDSIAGGTFTLYDTNNHFIDDVTPYTSPCNFHTATTALLQTNATANANTSPNFNQYNASEATAYSPAASTNSTVKAGTNEQSYCSALSTAASSDSTLSNAVSACQNATRYACGYLASTHSLSCGGPVPTVVARPASAAWDIGAYQTPGTAPASPTNPAAIAVP